MLQMQPFLETLRESVLQFFSSRVDQKNAEHLVVDQAVEQFGDAFEQLVQVENRREFARNLVQQEQCARLTRYTRVQPRILDAHRHARCDQRQQAFVLFREVTFYAQAVGDSLWIAYVETNVQFLKRFVEQQDRKNFIVNDFAYQFGHTPQRGFQIESGIHYVGHFEQEGFHLGSAQGLRGGRFHKHHLNKFSVLSSQ